MNTPFYMFLSSNDSIPYFSENKPHHFKVYFPESIILKPQSWTLALVEIEFTYSTTNNNRNIEIYTDITNESLIHGKKRRILRRVTIPTPQDKDLTINKGFFPLIPIIINTTELVSITLYICDEFGKPASFLKGKTDCTLEFKPTRARSRH
jgi:hypothetical protein